jgi:hypothetical protein
MKPFEKWKTQEVEDTFGIRQKETLPEMQAWLNTDFKIDAAEEKTLQKLQDLLRKFVDFWNEEDLKVFFILPLINLVDFYQWDKYRPFNEQLLEQEVPDVHNQLIKLRGFVELMVATGKQIPKIPFFFIQEYKPQFGPKNDPKGQLLCEMVATQAKNADNLPLYGLYVVGRSWFFVLLKDKDYIVSKAFDSYESDDLPCIVQMLKFVKAEIDKRVQ